MSEKNADFLAEIYRGARMGAETINTLVPKVEDKEIRNELLREQEEYRKFEAKAIKEIGKRGETPGPINKMQEMASSMGIKMNTAMDNSASHIADLMIQGNNMGIIGITKTSNSHKNAEPEIKELANELIHLQQNNIDNLKPFLK